LRISVEIAPGELLDKISILEIKRERISSPEKLTHIVAEWETLERSRLAAGIASPEVDALRAELKSVNETLWDIEDRLRVLERGRTFDDDFVQLARSVYLTNDRRAAIKLKINDLLGSDIAEAKSYESY